MREVCPNKRYSCILPYQRNILDFNTSLVWAQFVHYYGVFDMIVLTLLNEYRSQMSSKTRYLIWNTYSSSFLEVLHLLIPLFLAFPEISLTGARLPEFYVRRPVLEPRRPESLDKLDDNWNKVVVVRKAGRAAADPADICRPGPSWQQ